MPWLRSRRYLRFIVGDQHNSTSTTRELGFGLRAAQARCPHPPRSARVAAQWRLSHLEQRGWPTISSTTLDGKPPLADDEAWLGMTHLVLKSW